MTITVVPVLMLDDEDLREDCYKLYADIFADINQLAAQRHLLTHPEFSDVALDSRVIKLLAYNGAGDLIGIGAVTNHLAAHPLVSEPYYARMFPDQYARKALWYVMFVGVRPRAPHAFRAIIRELYAHTTSNQGIALMDFCSYNEEALKIDVRTEHVLRSWDQNTHRFKLDSQTTWGYRFDGGGLPVPGPLADATEAP